MMGSLFLGRMVEEPVLPPEPEEKKEYHVCGFGVIGAKETPIGGDFFVPEVPQILTVKGSAKIFGLNEVYELVEEEVTDSDTTNFYFRVLSVVGEAEVLAGSALVAKTYQGAWRTSGWSSGNTSLKADDFFLNTRGEMVTISLWCRNYVTGHIYLKKKFMVDMTMSCIPGEVEISPMTDIFWTASSSKNGGWASVSYCVE